MLHRAQELANGVSVVIMIGVYRLDQLAVAEGAAPGLRNEHLVPLLNR
jgi:hypothetical protein